jgi:protein-S-isoprenylcysteine O-methyltransferase Ste14
MRQIFSTARRHREERIRRRNTVEERRLRAAFRPKGDRGFSPRVTINHVPTPFLTLAWLISIPYSTIPSFWLLIHPHAAYWRSRRTSPYKILLPIWIAMSIALAAITFPWRHVTLYHDKRTLLPAALLFLTGILLYRLSRTNFTLAQLGGLPELLPGHNRQLITTGIRARLRHPVYLAHLCELLAWSLASALAVCWLLTAFAILTGALMIKLEDDELEKRFGAPYRAYRQAVPALIPKLKL